MREGWELIAMCPKLRCHATWGKLGGVVSKHEHGENA